MRLSETIPPLMVFLQNILQLATGQERTLRFVTLVYRHGDRSPLAPTQRIPTKQQLGQRDSSSSPRWDLVGILQQKALGKFLREKYDGFLSAAYKPQEIYIRSTDYDRTLMSAQANLMGLYSNSDPEIGWSPVPVHTVPIKYDKLLKSPTRTCQRYQHLMEETINLPSYQAKMEGWKGFIREMANYTGLKLEQLTLRGLWRVHDSLFCQKIHNLTLPSWATPRVLRTLAEVEAFNVEAHVGMHASQEKVRFTGGLLLDAILTNFSKIACRDLPLKMIMFSAHDSTLIALHGALGIYNGHPPPYAACHGFEFYQETNNSFSIGMFYRNTSDQPPHVVALPGCSTPCPLSRFIQLTRAVIPHDWETECQNPQKSTGRTVTALAVAVALLSILLIGVGVLYCRR